MASLSGSPDSNSDSSSGGSSSAEERLEDGAVCVEGSTESRTGRKKGRKAMNPEFARSNRKQQHKVAEQRRRNRFNDIIEEIRQLVPAVSDNNRKFNIQVNKLDVLVATVSHLQRSKEEFSKILAENRALHRKNEELLAKLSGCAPPLPMSSSPVPPSPSSSSASACSTTTDSHLHPHSMGSHFPSLDGLLNQMRFPAVPGRGGDPFFAHSHQQFVEQQQQSQPQVPHPLNTTIPPHRLASVSLVPGGPACSLLLNGALPVRHGVCPPHPAHIPQIVCSQNFVPQPQPQPQPQPVQPDVPSSPETCTPSPQMLTSSPEQEIEDSIFDPSALFGPSVPSSPELEEVYSSHSPVLSPSPTLPPSPPSSSPNSNSNRKRPASVAFCPQPVAISSVVSSASSQFQSHSQSQIKIESGYFTEPDDEVISSLPWDSTSCALPSLPPSLSSSSSSSSAAAAAVVPLVPPSPVVSEIDSTLGTSLLDSSGIPFRPSKRRVVNQFLLDSSRIALFSVVLMYFVLPESRVRSILSSSSVGARVLSSADALDDPASASRSPMFWRSNGQEMWVTLFFLWRSFLFAIEWTYHKIGMGFLIFSLGYLLLVSREIVFAPDDAILRRAKKERMNASLLYSQGNQEGARDAYVKCLALLSREPSESAITLLGRLSFEAVRQFLHICLVGRWIDSLYCDFMNARETYLEAASAYHGLFRLQIRSPKLSSRLGILQLFSFMLSCLNLAESSISVSFPFSIRGKRPLGPSDDDRESSAAQQALGEIYASITVYLQLYSNNLSRIALLFVGKAWSVIGLPSYRGINVDHTLGWLSYSSGVRSLSLGEWKRAISSLRRSATIFEENGRFTRSVDSVHHIGLAFFFQGKPWESLTLFDYSYLKSCSSGKEELEIRSMLLSACVLLWIGMEEPGERLVNAIEEMIDSTCTGTSTSTEEEEEEEEVLEEGYGANLGVPLSSRNGYKSKREIGKKEIDDWNHCCLRALHSFVALVRGEFETSLEHLCESVRLLPTHFNHYRPVGTFKLMIGVFQNEIALRLWEDILCSLERQKKLRKRTSSRSASPLSSIVGGGSTKGRDGDGDGDEDGPFSTLLQCPTVAWDVTSWVGNKDSSKGENNDNDTDDDEDDEIESKWKLIGEEGELSRRRSMVLNNNLENLDKRLCDVSGDCLSTLKDFQSDNPIGTPYYLFFFSIHEMMRGNERTAVELMKRSVTRVREMRLLGLEKIALRRIKAFPVLYREVLNGIKT